MKPKKNVLGLIVLIIAAIILLPVVLKLAFSILGLIIKIAFFALIIGGIWYGVRKVLR